MLYQTIEILLFLFSCYLIYQVFVSEVGKNLKESQMEDRHFEAFFTVYTTGVIASFIAFFATLIKLIL